MKTTGLSFSISKVSPLDQGVQKLIDELNTFNLSLYPAQYCHLESSEELVRNQSSMLGAFWEEQLVGIGAVKQLPGYAEVKRMFVKELYRGKGVAAQILHGLEEIARKQGNVFIRLETGSKHDAALKFYQKSGYYRIRKFGYYPINEVSLLMEKKL